MDLTLLKRQLDQLVTKYNNKDFIRLDPIGVPHRFKKQQDIEIAGFFAAILAWGQRTTIIKNANQLMELMDGAPHEFIVQHTDSDRKRFKSFVHRTFQPDDLLYFIEVLQHHYLNHPSLENLFADGIHPGDTHAGNALIHFHNSFFALPHLARTRKHIPTPERKSACKRLNLYLRWMVRNDRCGVDFGLWKRIRPDQLLCPLDVHVLNVANNLGLVKEKNSNWHTCLLLTDILKQMDPFDPVKYDFALFGSGIASKK